MTVTIDVALLQALKDRGARQIFGIPGDFVLPFFKSIEESKILPYYTLSHEPSVGYAADAAGRIDSTLGVAVVTYGAGALNMVNAVAQAYAEKSPLVVISGAPGAGEGAGGFGLHHQVKTLSSQYQIFKELTCDQAILNDPRTAPELIARVLDNARRLSRPVYLELPRDCVGLICDAVEPEKPVSVNREAALECAQEVLRRLQKAERPALLAGVEIRRHGLEDKVAKLASALSLPTATSFMGRGLLARRDCPLVGTYLGLAGDPAVTECVEGSDGLLMLGVILSDTNFGVSGEAIDRRRAIHAFDGDVRLGHYVYHDVSLEALVDSLLAVAEPIGSPKVPGCMPYPRGFSADSEGNRASDIATAVNDFFAEYGAMPIASDIGDCLFTAMEIENTELVAPGYYASMGMGVPAGIALQTATGKRPLVLVGDGAFQMTGWELGHCRKNGWSPIVIVFNNQSWEMLRTFQPGLPYHDLDDWRYADLAAPMGGRGHRVESRAELKQALDQAMTDDTCFHIVEVMLPRGETSQTLARFASAVRRHSVLKDA